MAEEQHTTPWAQSASGAIIINGVIAAVVGAVTGWALNNASKIPWDRVVYVGVGVAIGMFLVLTFVRKRLREAVWARPARWLWSWRPISARRHHRDLTAVLLDAEAQADVIAKRAIMDASDLANARQELSRIVADQSRRLAEAEQTWKLVSPQLPDLPRPAPRWKLFAIATNDDSLNGVRRYRIVNLPDSAVHRG